MNNYLDLIEETEFELKKDFHKINEIRRFNQRKVIKAMQDNFLSQSDFYWPTGYGYGDTGKEKTEAIYRDIFRTEDMLVRPNITSGTHALAIVLQALLMPGDKMVSVSGLPYDTLQKVIGISGDEPGNLSEYDIVYEQIDLKDGLFDLENFCPRILEDAKLVLIQRSMGYSSRRAHSIAEMDLAIRKIREIAPSSIIMVDNCYGEFTEIYEPSEIGADIIAGSLIKNPGGGIAITGGYIGGREDLVERCANRLTSPGLGKETGLAFGTTFSTLQGLFLAPQSVANALKGAMLIGRVFEKLDYETVPKSSDPRSDIVQGIILGNKDKIVSFCQSVQASGAVGAHILPMPWDMPGYEDQVIMAASGFVDGSSIEISADGPLREPLMVFYQGGTSYDQCVFALEKILSDFIEKGFI